MGAEKELKRPIANFIILTNIIFLPLFSLVGATIILGLPKPVFDITLCIAAWSSTFAFMILFKRIYPNQNFIGYVKGRFKNKLRFLIVAVLITIQVLIVAIVMFIYLFFSNLCSGPLGEELGWRGFAQNELQKKYSPLKASIIIGFWWGIWYSPIWFTTGFSELT